MQARERLIDSLTDHLQLLNEERLHVARFYESEEADGEVPAEESPHDLVERYTVLVIAVRKEHYGEPSVTPNSRQTPHACMMHIGHVHVPPARPLHVHLHVCRRAERGRASC